MKILINILLLFTFVNLIAQNDTIKKNNFNSDNVISHSIDAKFIDKNFEIDDKSFNISELLTTKPKQLGLSYKFDKNKYINLDRKPKTTILLKEKPMDDDILVIKHFNGKNTTKSKFKATQDFGTIESNTEFIRIEYRDFGSVDGDRVKIYLNEKVIDANVHLDGLYYTIHIRLTEKGFNKIDIQAINQGLYGPNTAEFVIYDDKGNVISNKTWNLKTNQIATLGIVKY